MAQRGRRYGGRYEVTAPIAAGGMAEVFLARDQLLGRQVALKILHPEYARDKSFIERFRREARAAASLNDPHIVSVFDWGSDDGTYYIVMEYVKGMSLRQLIETEGPLEPLRAAGIAADVCAALEFAHEQGIIHRDIKPANIAITASGQTKVMDFGIARQSRDSSQTVTQTGTVIGTAAYLSPEQAQGMSVDQRSDVYSVGVVLYEMLTGAVPFTADTPVAVAYKHVGETPRTPSKVNADVPAQMDAIVMKALAKNPDNRYQSAGDMRADLARAAAGRPVMATPLLSEDETAIVPRSEMTAVTRRGGDRTALMARPVSQPDRRRRAVYFLTFLLFLGLIVGAVALVFSLFGGGGAKIPVPDVVGMTLDEAQNTLEQQGFHWRQEASDFSETVAEGSVVSQDPEDGIKAEKGTTVSLVISKGPERIEVPDVVGLTEDDARKAIEAEGLKVGAVRTQISRDVDKGKVISQNPGARQVVERGTAIDLVISSGKETVKVPDVRGLSEENARKALLDRNLNPVVKEGCDKDAKAGAVIDQSPAAGTSVPEDSDVTITVNHQVRVPNVLGKSEEDAVSELQDAGFKVEVKHRNTVPGVQDAVVDQNPDGDKFACKGDTVTITVED